MNRDEIKKLVILLCKILCVKYRKIIAKTNKRYGDEVHLYLDDVIIFNHEDFENLNKDKIEFLEFLVGEIIQSASLMIYKMEKTYGKTYEKYCKLK